MKRHPFKIFMTALLLGAGLACGGDDRQAEARNLIGAAQNLIDRSNVLIKKTEARSRKLFDADVRTAEELAAYRLKMEPEARSIVENYTRATALLKEIAGKFEAAAALDGPEAFRIYAATRANEFSRLAEAYELRRDNALAFIADQSPKRMSDRFDENNSRFEKLAREAAELNAAANEIASEHGDFFARLK